ncbi:MAG: hypothetical protein GEV07_16905 [Streptosporangiales bacterium]|nr:hypothetical protein [Streptosporangiales bacterium]
MTTHTDPDSAVNNDCATAALVDMATGELDLLDQLARYRYLRDCLDAEMRRIVALGRMVTPWPYTLAALAKAAGMSISGVRTFAQPGDIAHVQNVLAARQLPTQLVPTHREESHDGDH